MTTFLKNKKIKFKCISIFFILSAIFLTTVFSYLKGEKLYFLIPPLLFSISYYQWFYFMPVLFTLGHPCTIKYKDLNFSIPPISNSILGNEMMASVAFIIYLVLINYFFIGTLMYTIYAIISMIFSSIYLNKKIKSEANKQKININFKNKILISDLTAQYWRKFEN